MKYQAQYQKEKIDSLATAIKCIVDSKEAYVDKTIPSQMINIGIRKLHDIAQSERGRGKYLGHPLWSKEALKLLEQHNGKVSKITKYLSHEHLVPLNIVVDDFIFSQPIGTSVEQFKTIIMKYAAVAIITRDEDSLFRKYKLNKTMPDNWSKEDVFSRYHAVGLYVELTQA